MSPRNWSKGLVALVAAAAAVVLCAIISVVVVTMGDDTPTKQTDASATAPQESTPDYPTSTSPPATDPGESMPETKKPLPTPTKSKTPASKKPTQPSGSGASKSVTRCAEPNSSKFAAYFDDHMVNGALRLELTSPSGGVTLYSSTSVSASVERKISDSAGKPNPNVTGVDWVLRQSKFSTDDKGEFYRIRYFCNTRLKLYGVYYRAGNTDWKLLQYPNDKKFYTDTYYQVAVFWSDPDAPKHEAPLPPMFSWGSVQHPASS